MISGDWSSDVCSSDLVVLSNLAVGIHVVSVSYVGGPGTSASNSLPGVHVVESPTSTATSSRASGTTALQMLVRAMQLVKSAVTPKR